MTRHRLRQAFSVGALAMLLPLQAAVGAAGTPTDPRPIPARPGAGAVLGSSGSASSFKSSDPDSFFLYGGPGSLLGKFQLSPGSGALPDLQGWSSRDATQVDPMWHPSLFNTPTGTLAMWCGQTVEQQPDWHSDGYGNGFNEYLTFRHTVADPSVGQVIDLSFVFNHDSEPGFDFFDVQYDSAGTLVRVLHLSGSNKDSGGVFTPLSYPADVTTTHDIVYTGGDYAGPNNDEVVIHLICRSDGAWSDQDYLWPTEGFAQVDNIDVVVDGVSYFEDFEGLPSGFRWEAQIDGFAGNYADIYSRITDLDPCRENPTPAIGFLDHPNAYQPGDASAVGDADGLLPKNPPYDGPPTVGSTDPNWNYGLPGGWVLNYSGGVSGGAMDLENDWWSPAIAWDDPTTTSDDAPEFAGLRLRGSIWQHLPLINGIFWTWEVRGYATNAQRWSDWSSRNLVYFGSTPEWVNLDADVTDLLPLYKSAVQFRWSGRDLASVYGFPGTSATPSPIFDNSTLVKYRVGGPFFATRSIDLFQDSFAQSGATSDQLGTAGERESHAVRVDMARDVNTGPWGPITPGDSIIVDVRSVIPGIAISDSLNQIRLHYALNMNPVFEAGIRGNLASTTTNATVAGGMYGWDQSVGTVAARQSYTSSGAPIANRYFFDLPDDHFLYPGDVLEYYIEAWDDAGNSSTLPSDLTGYDDDDATRPVPYSRVFTMRALPTYQNSAGDHPGVLLWNDFGRRGAEAEWVNSMGELGLLEGVEYDSYTTMGPSSLRGNGLGSAGAHGASAAQLDGYGCILYESGDLRSGLISDGDNAGSDDKSDDAGVLLSWWNGPGADRYMAHWGNHLATHLSSAGASATYLNTILNAVYVDASVRSAIGDQNYPRILPTGGVAGFSEEVIMAGGCPTVDDASTPLYLPGQDLSRRQEFDQVLPGPGAIATHAFEQAGSPGSPYDPDTIAAAGIYNATVDGSGGEKKSLFFPYGFLYILSPRNKIDPGNLTARTVLLAEALNILDAAHLIGGDVPAPSAPSLTVQGNVPNPFNPRTQLRFSLGQKGEGSVKIYNLRGELVRIAASGEFPAGLNVVEWAGRDDRGSAVSSGVYLVRYEIAGFSKSQKVALLK